VRHAEEGRGKAGRMPVVVGKGSVGGCKSARAGAVAAAGKGGR